MYTHLGSVCTVFIFYIHYESITYYRQKVFHSMIDDRKLIIFRICCRSLVDRDINKQSRQTDNTDYVTKKRIERVMIEK